MSIECGIRPDSGQGTVDQHDLRELSDQHRQCASRDRLESSHAPREMGRFLRCTRHIGRAGRSCHGRTNSLRRVRPRLLHLALEFRFTRVDAANYELGLDVKFPLGITVREDLSCVPIGTDQCRVNYRCGFGFPAGWRGTVARLLMRRELNSGPVDSLSRLRRAAEERYGTSARQLT